MTTPDIPTTLPTPIAIKPSRESLFLLVAIMLAVIDTTMKSDHFIGGWHIVFYLLLLLPIILLFARGELKNRYTLWFLPFILIWIGDLFYYNNTLTQHFLPTVVIISIILLSLSAVQETSGAYQSLLPKIAASFNPIRTLSALVNDAFSFQSDAKIFRRIFIALALTLPFFVVFTLLLRSADMQFATFLSGFTRLDRFFSVDSFVLTPLKTVALFLFFLYVASNFARRDPIRAGSRFDPLIVSIFLSLLALLFASFIAFQIPFLLQNNAGFYADSNVDHVAFFARQGFFQLMAVMGIVVSIYLVIMQRFQGERYLIVLMGGLLIETMIMGIVSIKKMALYQWLMGATVLRYYVEWFDYFLLGALALGIIFLFWRIHIHRLLDIIVVLALIAFTTVASLNVDYMVASHNIEKFADQPGKLDIGALSELSVDALPPMEAAGISRPQLFRKYDPRDERCHTFATYHFGYCSRLADYTSLSL